MLDGKVVVIETKFIASKIFVYIFTELATKLVRILFEILGRTVCLFSGYVLKQLLESQLLVCRLPIFFTFLVTFSEFTCAKPEVDEAAINRSFTTVNPGLCTTLYAIYLYLY